MKTLLVPKTFTIKGLKLAKIKFYPNDLSPLKPMFNFKFLFLLP